MYLLFREHNITPSEFYKMGEGEKRILHAFISQESDDYSRTTE